MNKVNSFVKSFVAIVQGDDATAQAEKAKRQADNALKTNISALNFETSAFEDTLESAKENEAKATVNNGQPITSKESYVRNLLDARNAVTNAEQALSRHQAKISFLKEKLDSLDAEVEA